MATIVTRAGKGSPLTHDEVDDNFSNLNTDKVETSAIGTAAAANTGDFATAAQGALADSAIQSGDLATVATTGSYSDLSGKPTLGTAAATASTDYATAAQGTLADSAVQPNDSPTFGAVTATSFSGDGSALTGVVTSTTAGAVGTHVFAGVYSPNTVPVEFGDTISGANLHPASVGRFNSGNAAYRGDTSTTLSGTWRCLGNVEALSQNDNSPGFGSLFVRIS